MPQPGWYADPADQTRQRYWDGAQWTEQVHSSTSWAPPPPVIAPHNLGMVAATGGMVAPKNPAVSLLISFFIPGVGSMVNGDTGTGVIILIVWLVGVLLTFVLIGVPVVIGAWIWGMIHAYQGARRWNARHGIIS